MRRKPLSLLLGTSLVLAGGGGWLTVRATGNPFDGCPRREKLVPPTIDFTQDTWSVTVTVTNPNLCYGFRDEPVQLEILGARGRHAITYFGEGPPHDDVGVCCNLTLPPKGTWTMTFGSEYTNQLGSRDLTICNITVDLRSNKGYDAWVRMPEGGHLAGRPSFPPGFERKLFPPKTPKAWSLAPCDYNPGSG